MSYSPRSAVIPPSPTSPPRSGLKRRRLSDNLPQSPISPSYMSVATKSYVSSYGNAQHTDEVTGHSSPRSPRGAPSRSQQSSSRMTPSLPTPAHSVTGNSGMDIADEADLHRDKRARFDDTRDNEEDEMEVEPLTRATNHDRQDVMDTDDGNAGGVRTGQHESGGGSVDETTLEQIQKDMGEAFLLCRSKVEPQRPSPQQHLLALYGLGPLLRSVARNDPKTGEKINKLRKSYEGQIKSFGLAGRNKPVKGERNADEDQPGQIRRIVGSLPWGLQPDEQWSAEHGGSKIEATPDFKAKLREAMHMRPGTVRNNAHWEDVLGFDKKPTVLPPQPVVNQLPVPRVPNGIPRQLGQPSAEAKRQTRGKKRSYGDDSFVGYGEGYSDPEGGDDTDEYGGQRKRKKDLAGTPVTYGQYQGR
ncbi:Rox3 mediator complex subunit-domain-containing protein [Exophiala viscosa]|uniref:Mediator of RNA polymerase II transcription subunit 19 n=1 Tax=Exophiala viscosa TaxID=2486360 RepID=A0AAN6E576_9EURO|nr:Rox3 mediator complex subunit-domain-containing protein [Exophiala viscosa]